MEDLFEPTIENLFIDKLSIKELESLLPCSRADVQKVVEDRITDLRNLMDAES